MFLGIVCVALGLLFTFIYHVIRETRMALIGLIGGVITILGGGLVCLFSNEESSLWYFVVLLLALCGLILVLFPLFWGFFVDFVDSGKKEQEKQEKILRYMTYDSKKGEVQIKKRGVPLCLAISVQEVVDRVTRYAPEKLHFGAVTVGGVTTGGTYKTGGFYQGEKIHTGKYALVYNNSFIKTIKLPPELVEEAKKASIKKYLDQDGKIVVVDDTKATDGLPADIAVNLAKNSMDAYLAYTQPYKWSHYPSQEKCKEILDWLCQE